MVLLSSIEFTKINILFSYIRIRKNVKWLQKVYLHIIFVYIGSLSIIYVRWKKNDGNYVQILSILMENYTYETINSSKQNVKWNHQDTLFICVNPIPNLYFPTTFPGIELSIYIQTITMVNSNKMILSGRVLWNDQQRLGQHCRN